MQALPNKDAETKKFPKAYLCDLIFTLVGDQFKAWVKREIDTRNQKVMVGGNLNIMMDPQIAAAFANTTAVST